MNGRDKRSHYGVRVLVMKNGRAGDVVTGWRALDDGSKRWLGAFGDAPGEPYPWSLSFGARHGESNHDSTSTAEDDKQGMIRTTPRARNACASCCTQQP